MHIRPGKYLSGWVGGWLAGLSENIVNSAQLKQELGLSLAIVENFYFRLQVGMFAAEQ